MNNAAHDSWLVQCSDALEQYGLSFRGGFVADSNEDMPEGRDGGTVRTVLLVGHQGASHWRHFLAWQRSQRPMPDNPLDTWSREVITQVADQCSARAVFPSDRPWLPFQQWAAKASGFGASPLGILIDPAAGLWHAYRGALLFETELVLPEEESSYPCETCVEKPCLTTCPVSAISIERFDVQSCASHVIGSAGGNCRNGGCLARNACPIGATYRYPQDMQAFHMAAFLSGNDEK